MQAPRRLSLRRPAPALSPRGGCLHLRPPPSSSQYGSTALDVAKEMTCTEVVKLLKKYTPAYLAAQVGRAMLRPPLPPSTSTFARSAPPVAAQPYNALPKVAQYDAAHRRRRLRRKSSVLLSGPRCPSTCGWA